MFMFESQLVQMPSPRDIILYWPGTRAFSVVQKPRGWAHISVQKPRGARGGGGNRSNRYLHYTKDGGPREGGLLCSFYHESLRTWIKIIVNKFAISNHTALMLGVRALRSYLKLICEYELHNLPIKKLAAQGIMVKTTSSSDRTWSAIFCLIVCSAHSPPLRFLWF